MDLYITWEAAGLVLVTAAVGLTTVIATNDGDCTAVIGSSTTDLRC